MPANKDDYCREEENLLSFELEDFKKLILLAVSWLGSLLCWLFEAYLN